MPYKLTEKDIEWINTKYPKLHIDTIRNIIEGELAFKIDYLGYKIQDTYKIRIALNELDTLGLPKVFEISGKIYQIANKYNISSTDLHINPGGSFCITAKGNEKYLFKNNFTYKEFFENGIENFLFQMSYFEKEGKLPWGEYAHGFLGYIEQFAEEEISFKDLIDRLDKFELAKALLINRQSKCLCGSNKKIRKCHMLLFSGINKMKSSFASR